MEPNRVIYDPDCENPGVGRVFMSVRCVSAYTFNENQIRGAHGKEQVSFHTFVEFVETAT